MFGRRVVRKIKKKSDCYRWRRDPPHWSWKEEGGEGGRQSGRICSSEFDRSPFTIYVKNKGQTYEEQSYRMFAF